MSDFLFILNKTILFRGVCDRHRSPYTTQYVMNAMQIDTFALCVFIVSKVRCTYLDWIYLPMFVDALVVVQTCLMLQYVSCRRVCECRAHLQLKRRVVTVSDFRKYRWPRHKRATSQQCRAERNDAALAQTSALPCSRDGLWVWIAGAVIPIRPNTNKTEYQ